MVESTHQNVDCDPEELSQEEQAAIDASEGYKKSFSKLAAQDLADING